MIGQRNFIFKWQQTACTKPFPWNPWTRSSWPWFSIRQQTRAFFLKHQIYLRFKITFYTIILLFTQHFLLRRILLLGRSDRRSTGFLGHKHLQLFKTATHQRILVFHHGFGGGRRLDEPVNHFCRRWTVEIFWCWNFCARQRQTLARFLDRSFFKRLQLVKKINYIFIESLSV